MPVTAKLSRRFYETFGDELTNELVEWFNLVDATYRSELRELNELNFARFDAKLEQRIAEVKADVASAESRLRAELASLESRLQGDMKSLEARLGGRIEALEGRIVGRFGVVEGRFGALESRLVLSMFLFWVASLGTVLALAKF